MPVGPKIVIYPITVGADVTIRIVTCIDKEGNAHEIEREVIERVKFPGEK